MAVILKTANHVNNAHEYQADVTADIDNLPTATEVGTGLGGSTLGACGLGATCYCIEDNAYYYLSAQNTWGLAGADPQLAPLTIVDDSGVAMADGAQLMGAEIHFSHPYETVDHIYYVLTSNGDTPTDPTSGSTEYSAESPPTIADSEATKIKVFATLTDYTDSAITSGSFTVAQVATPTLTANGEKLVGGTIAIACATSGATIYYTQTTNGDTPADPTDGSTEYTEPIAITAVATTKIKAIAYLEGYHTSEVSSVGSYTTAICATPVAAPVAGEVLVGSTVALTCATSGASIYYTTDGSTPDNTDTLYTAAITIPSAASTNIKAIAIKTGLRDSAVSDDTYTTAICATPVAEPVAGQLDDGDTVVLTCATSGAAIYYTTNGDTPTAASTLYTEAIAMAPCTLKAVAIKTGLRTSATLSAAYTVKLATPVADPVAGEVLVGSTVSYTCASSGVSMYYTTNGDTPDAEDTEYTAPIEITAASTQIKVIAIKAGYVSSTVSDDTFTTAQVVQPAIQTAAGELDYEDTVEITCATDGASIYYTTDGSTPDATDTLYEGAITMTAPCTLKAVGVKTGLRNSDADSEAYTMQLPTPTSSSEAGELADGTLLTLACAVAGTSLYYTTNGDTPDAEDTEYATPFAATPCTVKIIAIKAGWVSSEVASYIYTVKLATPVAAPVAGLLTVDGASNLVTITCASAGVTMYYTTNGDTPDSGDTEYTTPIEVTAAETIKVIAIKATYADSAVLSSAYTVKCATPAGDVASGAVEIGETVTLTTDTASAAIYYTTDGSAPTSGDTLYSSPIEITTAVTLKAIAIKADHTDSEILMLTYTISQVATPTADPAGGLTEGTAVGVPDSTEISLACSTSGSTIYYTLDGTWPTAASTEYTGVITLTDATHIRARAIKTLTHTDSEVLESFYEIV